MKLILLQYLSDLRERDELDAILPSLLSELGFNVISRPRRGVRQNGVDVAAVGPDDADNGKTKLFLFTIKPGNLTRNLWADRSPQAIHPSLDEIQEAYIHSRIPDEYKHLDIAICVCIGGELEEALQTQWTGYVQNKTTDRICFRLWNGDKLAQLLLSGVLSDELLATPLRTHFRKAIAMVDHPDVAYRFFVLLIRSLFDENGCDRSRLTRLRQVYISLWILYVWARDIRNLDAPYVASEYAILRIWNDCRHLIERHGKEAADCFLVFEQAIQLHFQIAEEFLIEKLSPYADKSFAMSLAVESRSPVDVNLALFEQLGRFSLLGLWYHWAASKQSHEDDAHAFLEARNHVLATVVRMINSKPNPLFSDSR